MSQQQEFVIRTYQEGFAALDTLHHAVRYLASQYSRAADKAITASIPPELANCVADYAERLLEMKVGGSWPATKAR